MKQNHTKYLACSARRCPSIQLARSQTSRKSPSQQTFSAAC
jgi:hypothetical protein